MTVEAQFLDQNVGDTLYVRWLIDYPPYAGTDPLALQTIIPPGQDSIRPPVFFAPNCIDNNIAQGLSHRLLLAVSDRPFGPVDPALPAWDTVSPGGFRVDAMWPFQLDCK
jgi:hypothetical protein